MLLGKCTACAGNALADADGKPHLHPTLGVLLCGRCHDRNCREFDLDVRSARLAQARSAHLSASQRALAPPARPPARSACH